MKMKKRFNYRHIICIFITIGFLACGVFLFPNALGRLIEGGRDIGLSVAYYFCEIFGIEHGITPTVNDLPKIPFFDFSQTPSEPSAPSTPLPDTWTGFQSNWAAYWRLWATWDNFAGYLSFLGNGLYTLCKAAIVILPFALVFYFCFRRYLRKENTDHDKDSRPLRVWKWLVGHTYRPVRAWLTELWHFIRERRAYGIIWLCLWLFYFNAFTILLEFFAFYFYFVVSFDVVNIYRQVYKLCMDLSAVVTFVPVWVWVLIGLWSFDRFRKRIAYARLMHFERQDCGFINARALVAMIVGTMGKGKTTTLVDMCLSTEVMFRDKAFEKILENDLKFPNFPWINLEMELRRAIEYHEVYNLATCRVFVAKKAMRWVKHECRAKMFNYDYERYGMTYDNKLEVVNVWQVIETYAQLYFIYIIQSSLLVANFSIRSDCLLSDLGNFPLWNGDFFHRDSRLIDSFSRHAHILDFDFLRLGKTVIENNKYRHALEFGVIAVSEIGKERRNALELRNRGIKATGDDTNQMNDGFNDGLKMRRHAATVDNFAFLKVISDEQRPESFGADARDNFDVIHIKEREENRLAMPFFSLGELLCGWLLGRFKRMYTQYRYVRGDNTLFMYLYKGLAARVERYYKRIHNLFGFNRLRVQVESGTLDGSFTEHNYFLSWKKIYSRRFATDCMSAFWLERALRSPVGLNDLREYETARATWEELKAQNSYFIRDLCNIENADTQEAETATDESPTVSEKVVEAFEEEKDLGYDLSDIAGL